MPLPTPQRISWKEWSANYKITTPTFELTSVEKPDMSPFLVHMTGKNAILKILRGENAPDDIPEQHGYLQASIPEYNNGVFNAKVVCFTESPTFSIDFFRYRSFRRWQADLRFGIGFDKSSLCAQGIRPAFYAEDELVRDFNYLHRQITEHPETIPVDNHINRMALEIIEKVYPLLFPLLQDTPSQGFMWEREWRHPSAEGFVFDHSSIKLICCPENEEDPIREVLRDNADNIEFVRTWREYDDITNYLKRQKPVWEAKGRQYEAAKKTENEASRLRQLLHSYHIALNSLQSYDEFIAHLRSESERIAQERAGLTETISQLETQLRRLEEEAARKEEAAKKTAAR